MILTEAEVLELVKKPVDSVIAINRDLQLRHKLHITGEGCEAHIEYLKDYETEEEFKLRKKDVEDFTRLITNEIIDAQSRWKSAQGTTKYYNFGTNGDKLAEEFKKEILSQVWKGGSMEVFIKQFLAAAIYEEFNGFFLIEKGAIVRTMQGDTEYAYEIKEGISTAIDTNAKLKPYIVFKCVDEVTQFRVTGKRVEYIVLTAGFVERNNKKIKLFRVIDDVTDYIVELDGTTPTISTEQLPIKHNAGKCPVVRVSTLRKYISNDNTLTSVIDNLLGPLDNLLNQYIDHTTTARKHNFPLSYQVGMECRYVFRTNNKCQDGTVFYQENGEEKQMQCPACKGTGKVHRTPSSIILLPATDQEGRPFDIKNVAGYVTPDIASFQEQRVDIDWWKQQIKSAGTGMLNGMTEQSITKTATETIMNTKPLEDIISENIDIIESVERDLTDLLGVIYFENKYLGCEIIYGRKLNLRDENTLLAEIEASKKAGASIMHIKTLHEELTYARFIRSEIDLQRNLILNELEPLIGFSYAEIEGSNSIDKRTKLYKQNFSDIIQVFELQNGRVENFQPKMEFNKRIALINEKIKAILDEKDFTTIKAGQLSEKQQDAQAQLRGTVGGTQGLIELNASVSLGQIDEETAITIVEQIYGYERTIAAKMITSVKNKPTPQITKPEPAAPANITP